MPWLRAVFKNSNNNTNQGFHGYLW